VKYPAGTIIYFTPFYYPDGQRAAEPKYFLVLRQVDAEMTVASLPSSQPHYPAKLAPKHGCNRFGQGYGFYMFGSKRIITLEGWGFPLDTFVYPWGVKSYDREMLKEVYPKEGKDYAVRGRLTEGEFISLITCLNTSDDLPGKMARLIREVEY
jgi:hypothetical protein